MCVVCRWIVEEWSLSPGSYHFADRAHPAVAHVAHSVVQPSHPPVLLPDPLPLAAVHRYNLPPPVALAVDPLSFVLAPVRPGVRAQPMLLVELVGPLISAPVLPGVLPVTVHLVVEPFAPVSAPVCPDILAIACDLVVKPGAGIETAVLPDVLPLPALLALLVVALISAAVHPGLHPVPVLEIVQPAAVVTCPVVVSVDALPARLVVPPLSLVDVTVDVGELAVACCLTILPGALISCSVGPHLQPVPVSHIAQPLARVNHSVLEPNWFSLLDVSLVHARVHRRPCSAHSIIMGSDGGKILLVFLGQTGAAACIRGYQGRFSLPGGALRVSSVRPTQRLLRGLLSSSPLRHISHQLPITNIIMHLVGLFTH